MKALKVIGVLTLVVLAGMEVLDIKRAIFTTDEKVARLCDSTIDNALRTWCYSQYGRSPQ